MKESILSEPSAAIPRMHPGDQTLRLGDSEEPDAANQQAHQGNRETHPSLRRSIRSIVS